jgi:hypothetical protein
MFIKNRKHKSNKGEFIPKRPDKYIGRYPIIVRSSWERSFCQWLDANNNIKKWNSEGINIRYFDKFQQKYRRYYPDFYIEILGKDDKILKYLIEIKPYKETKPPIKSKRKSNKTIMTEEKTYAINQAKFEAAKKYCKKMGYIWKILTEKELFGK